MATEDHLPDSLPHGQLPQQSQKPHQKNDEPIAVTEDEIGAVEPPLKAEPKTDESLPVTDNETDAVEQPSKAKPQMNWLRKIATLNSLVQTSSTTSLSASRRGLKSEKSSWKKKSERKLSTLAKSKSSPTIFSEDPVPPLSVSGFLGVDYTLDSVYSRLMGTKLDK